MNLRAMKLRAEMTEDSEDKRKLVHGLTEIETLVKEGLAYARAMHGDGETPSRIDIGSFVDSLSTTTRTPARPSPSCSVPAAPSRRARTPCAAS